MLMWQALYNGLISPGFSHLRILKIYFFFIIFKCCAYFCLCVYVHISEGIGGGQKKALDSLEVELQVAVSHPDMGAGN